MMAARKERPRSKIGPYQILAKIGEGGMGTVYLTKMDGPAGFNKLAVVKELRADLTGSKEFVQMFLNEARLAARLTHPNVVHTYGANEDDGRLYLAMEYLDGQPWSRIRHALWENGSLPFALHVKVLAETLAGLHYAHELRDYDSRPLQVVHCDMSPQNVFVTYDGQVRVVDFGVARAVTGERRSGTDMLVGKLAYIAPEQSRGEELDRRADVFAVGVMLWEALAGKRFADGQDWREMRRRRAVGAEPRVREVVPNAPRKLADICDRSLALKPDNRFATAAEFRDALLGYLAEDMQDVDHVQLGELVSRAFQDDRARVHSIIERHLKGPSVLQSSVEDLVASLRPEPAEYTLKADLSELASVSRLRDDAAVVNASTSASIRVERRRPKLAVIAAAMAGLIAIVWLARLASTPSDPVVTVLPLPTTAAVPSAAATSLTAAAPSAATATLGSQNVATGPSTAAKTATVQLVVTASPAEATILMDGVPLRSNPFNERVRADGEIHLLRAFGPGLQNQERVIALDRDRVVSFKLARAPFSSSRSSARSSSRRTPPTSEPPSAAPADPTTEPAAPANTRAKAEGAFDAPILQGASTREIYDEDPYR